MEVSRNPYYDKIKKKFLLLFTLNVSDLAFTLLLLDTGLFREINGIMQKVINDPILSILLKCGFVGVLLLIVYKRMKKATDKQLRLSNIIVNFAIFLYILINFSHIFWIYLFIKSYILINMAFVLNL